ncbi:MAG: domain S-box/diguanylate cyclase protein [Anaerocolumna sp.]|jgi:diguanylate cyclase (GGDEF)-like protein/PAS domain S-box-containing protein|nr:domain S-box/diguanylate cyclase protein [Anaerocolumna sp.]
MLRVGDEFYKNMLENIYDGVYFVDNERKITFWNKGAERITGFTAAEVIDHFCFDNILNHINEDGVQLCQHLCPLENTIKTGNKGEISVFLHHKNGYRVPITVKAVPIYQGEKIIGAVEIFTDDSNKQVLLDNMNELKIIAMIDQLTELPNRRYVETKLISKLNEYANLGIPFGIAFMDIDHFKKFNDTYGHDVGDEILKMVSNTFKNNIRSSDFIGRWGGEEFVAIMTNVNQEKLFHLSQKLRALIEKSVMRKGTEELRVTISIGSTICQENDSMNTILKRADELLYKSKGNGRNMVSVE